MGEAGHGDDNGSIVIEAQEAIKDARLLVMELETIAAITDDARLRTLCVLMANFAKRTTNLAGLVLDRQLQQESFTTTTATVILGRLDKIDSLQDPIALSNGWLSIIHRAGVQAERALSWLSHPMGWGPIHALFDLKQLQLALTVAEEQIAILQAKRTVDGASLLAVEQRLSVLSRWEREEPGYRIDGEPSRRLVEITLALNEVVAARAANEASE